MEEIFSRHADFWGKEKQEIIRDSRLLIAGVGGLGTTVSQILVRAGIGKLYLLDKGNVDAPDLNRQSLYFSEDLGKKKVEAAADRLRKIHDKTEIIPIYQEIDSEFQLPEDIDGVLDCLDNYQSRFYLERAIPEDGFYVHGGVSGDFGQVLTLVKGRSKSLEEIYSNCELQQNSPLSITPEIVFAVASVMAKEGIFNLWGEPKLLDRFLIIEFSDFEFNFLEI